MSRPSRLWLIFGPKCLCLTALLTFMAGSASAYTQTLSVGPGILSYSVSQTNGTCYNGGPTSYTQWNFSGFVFTPSGGSGQSLGGSAIYFQSPGGSNCPPNGAQPSPLVLSGSGYNINFYASSGGGSATYQATTTYTMYPAYKVLNIVYLPPGNQSNVGYTNTLSEGTITSMKDSFKVGTLVDYSGSVGFGPWKSTWDFNYEMNNTTGDATKFTENIDSTTQVTYLSPLDPVDHTKDKISLWLNPSVTITQTGSNTVAYSTGTKDKGLDGNPVMDTCSASVAQLQNPKLLTVGQLVSQTIDGVTMPGLLTLCKSRMAESQCTPAQASANGCGCVASDFADIVKQDPFFYPNVPQNATPAQVNQVLPNRFQYLQTDRLQNAAPISFTISDSNSSSNSYTTENKDTVGWAVGFSFSLPGVFTVSWKDTTTFTWTDSMSFGPTHGIAHIQTAAFATTNPNCFENVDSYLDTVYHSYLFVEDTPGACP